MRKTRTEGSHDSEISGFSLTELVVVVMIIAILLATSLPAILRYIRNYQIEGAASQVASEIQKARLQAITRNVNLGVVFVITNATQYQSVLEDDTRPHSGAQVPPFWTDYPAEPWAAMAQAGVALFTVQSSPIRDLPVGIQFDNSAACTARTINAAGGVNRWGFRFNRLGAWCDPGTLGCPPPAGGAAPPLPTTNFVVNNLGATICLTQPLTTLRKIIIVETGGRVRILPGEVG